MKTCLLIVVIHGIYAINCASINIPAVVEGNQTEKIQDLEKEKVEIYNQLNDAVEDTIKTLEKSNDSDAKQGIAYMHELLALIDKFNGTELKLGQACNGSKECTSNQTTISKTANSSIFIEDGRRQGLNSNVKPKSKYIPGGYDHIKHSLMATGMFKNDEELNRIKDEKVRKILKLQSKLDKWLKLREAEKQKIKKYRLKQVSNWHDGVTEECPNFGEMRKKSSAKKFGGKSKGEESRKPRKYPCCRKCCKKSYMGCL